MRLVIRLGSLRLASVTVASVVAVSGCLLQPAGRTFPPGTELVFINRTITAVEMYEGVIQPCSESVYDQVAIDRVEAMRRNGTFPPAPAGTVDLTTTGFDAPGKPKPWIIVILEGEEMLGYFGSVPDAELPPCQGQAVAPT